MTAQTSPSRSSRISAIKTIVLCLLAGLFSMAFAQSTATTLYVQMVHAKW